MNETLIYRLNAEKRGVIEIIFTDTIVAGGTPATAMAAVGVPINRKLKIEMLTDIEF